MKDIIQQKTLYIVLGTGGMVQDFDFEVLGIEKELMLIGNVQ